MPAPTPSDNVSRHKARLVIFLTYVIVLASDVTVRPRYLPLLWHTIPPDVFKMEPRCCRVPRITWPAAWKQRILIINRLYFRNHTFIQIKGTTMCHPLATFCSFQRRGKCCWTWHLWPTRTVGLERNSLCKSLLVGVQYDAENHWSNEVVRRLQLALQRRRRKKTQLY